jgi:hypothetical protein
MTGKTTDPQKTCPELIEEPFGGSLEESGKNSEYSSICVFLFFYICFLVVCGGLNCRDDLVCCSSLFEDVYEVVICLLYIYRKSTGC